MAKLPGDRRLPSVASVYTHQNNLAAKTFYPVEYAKNHRAHQTIGGDVPGAFSPGCSSRFQSWGCPKLRAASLSAISLRCIVSDTAWVRRGALWIEVSRLWRPLAVLVVIKVHLNREQTERYDFYNRNFKGSRDSLRRIPTKAKPSLSSSRLKSRLLRLPGVSSQMRKCLTSCSILQTANGQYPP